ncbi:hypothetical protein [Deinococcus arenicola]|uniref:MFS transporter n=1 Tax=Deinococcus arenicola TaxID=2994950 RepID=A0ABU4DME5_9DEIO|nr:hypothetical protein [Deinococcus sp. ZS9-10]MDV6373606.1 hypothetical protein [Deinococcus sp. ZS9-10]
MTGKAPEERTLARPFGQKLKTLLTNALFISDSTLFISNAAVGHGLAMTFLLLLPFLPTAILAWTEPDIRE